jgi:hypothetical protein
MRFKLGLAIGFAAGYWYGSLPEEQRKQKLDEAVQKVRDNPRLQRVGDTVSRNTTKLADAVESRVVETADRTTDAGASTAASDQAKAAKTTADLPGTGIG